jgi:hypothetical protein
VGQSAPDTCGRRGGLVEGDFPAGTDTCGRRGGLVEGDSPAETDTCGRRGGLVEGDSPAETDTCGRRGDLVEGDSPGTDTCLACASYPVEETARDSPAGGQGRVPSILDNNTAAETDGEEGTFDGLVVCTSRGAAGDKTH